MLRSMTRFAASILLLASVTAAARHDSFAQPAAKAGGPPTARGASRENRAGDTQRSTSAPLPDDPMTQGSEPYTEAVRRFLAKDKLKIIGGKEAPAGAFPWQVSLGVSWITSPEYAHFCGGSVYSERWVVTAAHCVRNTAPSQIVITAGTNRLLPGSTQRNVNRIIVHKDYNHATSDNDIALLELLDPLPFGYGIAPVALLTPADEAGVLPDSAPLVVTGWGAVTEGGGTVRDLRYLDNLPYVSRSVCNEPLSYDGHVTNNMICAGAPGRDSCQGDSGGPLTAETAATPKLAGIVSWGEGCGRPDKYGVYTRVANYVEWVNACVVGSPGCNK